MANPLRLPHEQVIDEFKNVVKAHTLQAICGRHFIRTEKLKQWMQPNAEKLLEAAYHRRSTPAPPIAARYVCRANDCSLIVFAILLEIGHGDLIHIFHRQGMVDKKLPIDLDTLKTRLGGSEQLKFQAGFSDISAIEALAASFDNRQWRFCPAEFHLGDEKDYYENQIIPILKKAVINKKGGFATVWQIEILEDFVGQNLRKEVSTSKFLPKNDNLGYRYNFALKTFPEKKRADYENEIAAFQALEDHEGIIRYLGEFGHRDYITNQTTYNILLEFGELDLDEFFFDQNILPPVLSTEVGKFWKDLFEVATAVKEIHLFKRGGIETDQEYYGWHADIKPDNILQVRGRFKLADPGFAKFEKKKAITLLQEERDQTTRIQGGTKTFGAPECHPGPRRQIHVPRSIDIWSLGCVFSLAASWVVLGSPGIVQFTIVRQEAIRKLSAQGSLHSSVKPGSDFFHDGENVLKDVLHWHDHLRKSCRKTDTITSDVLDLVDRSMLQGDADKRIAALTLCEELDKILAARRPKAENNLPESLKAALLKAEDRARSQPPPSKAATGPTANLLGVDALQDRQSRKSNRLQDPHLIPTTGRSEALRAENAPVDEPGGHWRNVSGIHDEKIPVPTPQSTPAGLGVDVPGHLPTNSPTRANHTRNQHSVSKHPNLHRSPTPGVSTSSTLIGSSFGVQNVWQARLDIERKQGLFKRDKKDKVLSQHFGKRDIQFLVDNAETMADYWDEAIYLLETLVMKAKGQDENGMDLAFTNGQVNLKNSSKVAKFREKMEDQGAKPGGHGIHTNLKKSLGDLLNKYIQDMRISIRRGDMRKLTILVLTDGIWAGMNDKHDVDKMIVEFATELKRVQGTSLQDRQVSIEFIQFGFDPEASYRLRRLDDELPFKGVADIVDTEHSRGDVNKMLLGSFVEEYDKKDEDVITLNETPMNSDSYFDSLETTPTRSRDSRIVPERQLQASPPTVEGYPTTQRTGTLDAGHARYPSLTHRQPPSLVLPPDHQESSGGYGGSS